MSLNEQCAAKLRSALEVLGDEYARAGKRSERARGAFRQAWQAVRELERSKAARKHVRRHRKES